LLLGIGVLPGVALVVGGIPQDMRVGVVVGVVAALLVAIFGSLNKRFVHDGDPLAVTGLELGAGLIALTLLAPVMPWIMPQLAGPVFSLPPAPDVWLLLALALACTLLPFTLSFVALRHMSAFSAQLAVSLEPVYAIVLAIVLLGEQRELTTQFYIGVAIILCVVLVHPRFARPREVEHLAID
jgi:drug/metabolite transporter (DMT)-like permease